MSKSEVSVSYQRLRDLIRADIVAGEFTPGSRLKIPFLCERYGASAIPVREALQVLSGEGLVVMEANRGATVRAIDAHFMEDIYEIRRVLEVYIVQRFIECAPQGAIEQIASIQAEMEAFEDAEALAERHACDIRFHQAIASAIDNSEIGLIVDRHTNIIDAVMRQFGQTPARLRQVRHEHRALVSALAGGNVELATQTVSDHFAHARADLSSLMRRAGRNAN